jgi:hypothetical protein
VLGSAPLAGDALCPGPTRDGSANGDALCRGPPRDGSANGDSAEVGGSGSGSGGRAPLSLVAMAARGSSDALPAAIRGRGESGGLGVASMAGLEKSIPPLIMGAGMGADMGADDRRGSGSDGRAPSPPVAVTGDEKSIPPLAGVLDRGLLAGATRRPLSSPVAVTGSEKSVPPLVGGFDCGLLAGAAGIPGLVAVIGSEKSIPPLVIGADDRRGSTAGPAGMSRVPVARAGGAGGPPPEVRRRVGFGAGPGGAVRARFGGRGMTGAPICVGLHPRATVWTRVGDSGEVAVLRTSSARLTSEACGVLWPLSHSATSIASISTTSLRTGGGMAGLVIVVVWPLRPVLRLLQPRGPRWGIASLRSASPTRRRRRTA